MPNEAPLIKLSLCNRISRNCRTGLLWKISCQHSNLKDFLGKQRNTRRYSWNQRSRCFLITFSLGRALTPLHFRWSPGRAIQWGKTSSWKLSSRLPSVSQVSGQPLLPLAVAKVTPHCCHKDYSGISLTSRATKCEALSTKAAWWVNEMKIWMA